MKQENKIKKPYIICIVGPAGSGKDAISEIIEELSEGDIQRVVSFTTRSIRADEMDGREHFFVDENVLNIAKSTSNVLAYTKYGGYDYWTQLSQFEPGNMYVYVIDEAGVRFLKANFGDSFDTLTLLINCDEDIIVKRGVSEDRIVRDRSRIKLSPQEVDFSLSNNGTLEMLTDYIYLLIKYAKKQHGSSKD